MLYKCFTERGILIAKYDQETDIHRGNEDVRWEF